MIYVFINQRLFKVQGGVAKKCGCRDIGSLRHSCKVIHAIPVKKQSLLIISIPKKVAMYIGISLAQDKECL